MINISIIFNSFLNTICLVYKLEKKRKKKQRKRPSKDFNLLLKRKLMQVDKTTILAIDTLKQE